MGEVRTMFCIQCRRTFLAPYRPPSSPPQRFCTRQCHGIYRKGKRMVCRRPVVPRTCAYCGKPFVPKVKQRRADGQVSEFVLHQSKARFCCHAHANRWRGDQAIAAHNGQEPPWKEQARQRSRAYKLVQKAIARGEVPFPEGWSIHDPDVKAWADVRIAEIDQRNEDRRRYAARSNWPASLSLRQVQILNVLAATGLPTKMTQIAAVIGLRPNDCAKHVKALTGAGLVVRISTGNAATYTLGPVALSILEEKVKCEGNDVTN